MNVWESKKLRGRVKPTVTRGHGVVCNLDVSEIEWYI